MNNYSIVNLQKQYSIPFTDKIKNQNKSLINTEISLDFFKNKFMCKILDFYLCSFYNFEFIK